MSLIQLVNNWLSIEVAYNNQLASKTTFDNIFDDLHHALKTYSAVKPIFHEYKEDGGIYF